MKAPPTQSKFNSDGTPSEAWLDWFDEVFRMSKINQGSGTTAERPTNGVDVGDRYFDTTLGYIIYYTGSGWVDSSGSSI